MISQDEYTAAMRVVEAYQAQEMAARDAVVDLRGAAHRAWAKEALENPIKYDAVYLDGIEPGADSSTTYRRPIRTLDLGYQVGIWRQHRDEYQALTARARVLFPYEEELVEGPGLLK